MTRYGTVMAAFLRGPDRTQTHLTRARGGTRPKGDYVYRPSRRPSWGVRSVDELLLLAHLGGSNGKQHRSYREQKPKIQIHATARRAKMSAWFVACQLSGYPAADNIVGATEYAETCFSTIDMPWAHVVGGQVAGGQGWSIAGRSVSGLGAWRRLRRSSRRERLGLGE